MRIPLPRTPMMKHKRRSGEACDRACALGSV
jgi:hypothetical protein